MPFDDYIRAIDACKVYDVAQVTPLDPAPGLSARLGNDIRLKREDLQPVFSFKLRGAYNKIAHLSQREQRAGVIAASAGNHAQGVALAARKLGIRALIVMPRTTPRIKVEAVRLLGADIIQHGDAYDQACEHALQLAGEREMTFVHPYDDPHVIAGQGSVGKEIHEQFHGELHAVFAPVGGGGLVAGVAAYLKHARPDTRVIGVEPQDAPTLDAALRCGEPVTLEHVGLFADGAAVRRIGDETFRVAQHTVDEVVLVTTDEICAAVKDHFDDTRTLLEPAGALSIAGMKKYAREKQLRGRSLVAIASGANINFDRLKHIVERYEIGEGSESLLAVTIPERPGSFLDFCRAIGRRTITEFNYRYADNEQACIFVGLQFDDAAAEKDATIATLREHGYRVADLSDNEMAKLHLRHMIGGHAGHPDGERLCRFQFPERPGALLEFLEYIGGRRWNISLFHYRNHGAAYGRVLAGIQVPDDELAGFTALLEKSQYAYRDESQNPAYNLFLA
ncbi:MAG: threonine ammonia-lyase, biosynthetic [Gammaproteobacteria bacterium]|nr:threonine ammonia-lyase, biosynthetic [Gammaproteobacteria bacterium]